jgi:hypothetical protein
MSMQSFELRAARGMDTSGAAIRGRHTGPHGRRCLGYESALQFVRTLVPATHPVVRRWEREYRAVLKELGR